MMNVQAMIEVKPTDAGESKDTGENHGKLTETVGVGETVPFADWLLSELP